MNSSPTKNNKLKIAVLFFGHLRTYEHCVRSVKKHLLSLYDCDVYMHTWNWTEAETKTWHNSYTNRLSVDDKIIEYLKDVYSLKNIQVDEELSKEGDELLPILCEKDCKISSIGLKSMITSLKRVTDLCVKSDVRYDYVVTIRPDVFLKKDLFLDDLDEELKVNSFSSSIFYAFNPFFTKNHPLAFNRASDVIQVGKLEDISRMIEVLNKIDFSTCKIWNPETLYKKLGQENGLIFHALNYFYEQDWKIIRNFKKLENGEKKRKFLKKILRLRVCWNLFRLRLFEFLPINLCSFEFKLFEKVNVNVNIGRNISC